MTMDDKVGRSIVNINRDTKIYGSFSSEPGNFGCEFHNLGFQTLGINAIYKSFRISSIRQALEAMRTLDIKGAGISMPFKRDVIKYADVLSEEVELIGAANTLVQDSDGHIEARNTDYIAAKEFLANYKFDILNILGNGGYSRAVQYACQLMGKKFRIFDRNNWADLYLLHDATIFNCTPVSLHPPESCRYIDCLISTQTGRALSFLQAAAQFLFYTGQSYPFDD